MQFLKKFNSYQAAEDAMDSSNRPRPVIAIVENFSEDASHKYKSLHASLYPNLDIAFLYDNEIVNASDVL